MSTEKTTPVNEDIFTPGFVGTDAESLEALSYWSSFASLMTSVNQMVNLDNKRAIMTAVCAKLNQTLDQLAAPAVTSMQAHAVAPAMPAPAPIEVAPVPTAAEDEHEEQPVNQAPSTQVDAPEVVALGDGEEEADPDKKAVVDLTMQMESTDKIKNVFHGLEAEIKKFLEGGELSDKLYERAFGYYCATGEMPYGTAKARDGDPWNWVSNHLRSDLGKVKESLEEPNASIFQKKTLTTQRMRELAGLATKI